MSEDTTPWYIRMFRSLETIRLGPFEAAYLPGLINLALGIGIALVCGRWWIGFISFGLHLALSWNTARVRERYGVEDVTTKREEVLLVLAKSGNPVAVAELLRRWNLE